MIINEQIEMEKIIDKVKEQEKIPSLLLHSCCAPCSSYVLETLSDYFNITILYYNPNIYPEEEYIKRKNEEKRFIQEFPSKNKIRFMDCDYEGNIFIEMAKGLENLKEGGCLMTESNAKENLKEGEKRCYLCYELRMKKTALLAKTNNFDYFTTTLSISPYKNSIWINEIGRKLEKKFNILYLPADFKKKNGYKRSIELSNTYNLYRQDYCGCIYSKVEREKQKQAVHN